MNEDKTEAMQNAAEDAAESVTNAAEDAAETVEETVDDAADKADETADDFRDALSNFSASLDRLGRAAEKKARTEWAEGKPEIERAMGEVKKGLDGLIRKSTGLIDSVSGKLSKNGEPAAEATDAPAEDAPAETPADDTPETPQQV